MWLLENSYSLWSHMNCAGKKILINSFYTIILWKEWEQKSENEDVIIEGIFLVISSFVFVVDSTMNLISKFHYIWLWEKEIPMFILREYLRITHNKNINYIVNCIKKERKSLKIKRREIVMQAKTNWEG